MKTTELKYCSRRRSGEEAYGCPFWKWAQNVKIFTSHIHEHPRECTVEEELDKMHKTSCPVDVGPPQFLTQWTPE